MPIPRGRFYLTHELPVDVDAVLHIDAKLPDGEERSMTIPEPGLWPPERRRHYQALANAANTLVEGDEYQAVLPKAIAGAILRSWGATSGTVRIERHLPLQMEEVASSDPSQSDPFSPRHYSTVYEAHVLVSPSGQVDLVKKVAAGEVAPVDKKAADKKRRQKSCRSKAGRQKPGRQCRRRRFFRRPISQQWRGQLTCSARSPIISAAWSTAWPTAGTAFGSRPAIPIRSA